MTETKFTPGPWNVGTARLVWVNGTDIAQVVRTNGDQVTAMANARLIAAAPDLFEAVSAFIDYNDRTDDDDDVATMLAYGKALAFARAAIAKALGEGE